MIWAASLLCVMASQSISAKDILLRSWSQTLVVGHRGAAAHAPENTLAGFRLAIASGAVATECDVHLDAEGNLAVIHDNTVDRTTTGKGRVKEKSSAELRALGVPTLADLTAVTKDRIVLVVEIKDGEDAPRKVVEHIQSQGMTDQTIVFSFHAKFVEATKTLDPKQTAIWLVSGKPTGEKLDEVMAQAEAIRADGLGFSYQGVTEEAIAAAHKRKLPVFVWTVPPGPEVERLRALKANFIITDHPKEVVEQLAQSTSNNHHIVSKTARISG